MLKLIEAKHLDLLQVVEDIPYIHAGYVNTLNPPKTKGSSDGDS